MVAQVATLILPPAVVAVAQVATQVTVAWEASDPLFRQLVAVMAAVAAVAAEVRAEMPDKTAPAAAEPKY